MTLKNNTEYFGLICNADTFETRITKYYNSISTKSLSELMRFIFNELAKEENKGRMLIVEIIEDLEDDEIAILDHYHTIIK